MYINFSLRNPIDKQVQNPLLCINKRQKSKLLWTSCSFSKKLMENGSKRTLLCNINCWFINEFSSLKETNILQWPRQKVHTVFGKAREESPPWAHTSGGLLNQLHLFICICINIGKLQSSVLETLTKKLNKKA